MTGRRAGYLLAAIVVGCSADPAPTRRPPPGGSRPARAPAPAWPSATCAVDADCELRPVVTCCGECAPVPPFEPVSRAAIDTLLLETEERCLRDRQPCPPCQRVPAGCIATARCREGRCAVDAVGCERPTS